MRVDIVSVSDISPGAPKTAYRLHHGLRSAGVNSKMFVQEAFGDDRDVYGPVSNIAKAWNKLRPYMDRAPLVFSPKRRSISFHSQWMPDQLSSTVSRQNADIVHLHWVCGGCLRIESLMRFRRPIVWTMHDMWAFTGGCHYSGNCKRYEESCGLCPILGERGCHDLSHKVWRRKMKAWRDLDLTIVAPSRWMADCVKKSSLFRNVRVDVIPNGIDLTQYRPFDQRMARDIWGLPQDRKLVAFGAMNPLSDSRKGFSHLQCAFKKLAMRGDAGNITAVVFGASEPVCPPDFGVDIIYMGRLVDDISLALLYAAVDVVVIPSVEDNLPNTVLEALACGTPCVSFEVGGIPDMIEHRGNGYMARPYDTDDLAEGVAWVLRESGGDAALSRRARMSIEERFSMKTCVVKHIELYEELLGGKS